MKGYHDIPGDGGSQVLEQVSEIRSRIERKLAGVRRLLAVGSGKGGVGKSTLAMQVAQALIEQGERVAVLDADLNGPSQARLGGLTKAPLLPGRHGLAIPRTRSGVGVVSLGSWIPEDRSLEFASVVTGESHVWRATKELSFLAELLASADWGELDALLVDLPPGPERTVQYAEFLGPAAGVVLVTVPSDLARGVVSRAASALERASVRVLGYVENMNGYWCEECRTIRPLFPDSKRIELPVPLLGSVPFDPELARASDLGEHFAGSERPAVEAVRRVAASIREAWEES